MWQIKEYPIPREPGEFTLDLPLDAKILSIQMRPTKVYIADLDPYLCVQEYVDEGEIIKRNFYVMGPDEKIDGEYIYVGSFLDRSRKDTARRELHHVYVNDIGEIPPRAHKQ